MPYKLVPVEATLPAFEELMEAEFDSYEDPPQSFYHLFCPRIGDGPEGRTAGIKAAAARALARHKAQPNGWWGKVVDDNGKIAGGCLWLIHKSNPYDKHEEHPIDFHPEGEEREYVTEAIRQFLVPRESMSNRPHVFLYVIFTHPDYRLQGVANMILDWGKQRANELGVEMWLDATKYGRPVYEKHGFIVVQENKILPTKPNAGEVWKKLDERLQPMVFWVMWRPAGGVYVEGKTVKPWETEAAVST